MKDRIQAILDALKLRQKDMAERLGVGNNVVNKWVKGNSEPSKGVRGNICATFGVRREWLETGDGEMFEKRAKTLADATFEELQEAYINALLEQLPPDVQARVVEFVGRMIEKRKQREADEKKRAELERLEAELAAEREEARRVEEEAEREAERARRQYWVDHYKSLKDGTYKSRAEREREARATERRNVFPSALNAFERVDTVNVDQRGATNGTPAPPSETRENTDAPREEWTEKLVELQRRKRAEFGLDAEEGKDDK